MSNWQEFERLVTEAKTHLSVEANEFARRVALRILVRGVERTGGDVQKYRDAIHMLTGANGRMVMVRGKRTPKHYSRGTMWLRGKDVEQWLPPKAP